MALTGPTEEADMDSEFFRQGNDSDDHDALYSFLQGSLDDPTVNQKLDDVYKIIVA